MQRINRRVFKDPAGLLENMRAATEHIRRRLESSQKEPDRTWRFPELVRAKDGRDCWVDEAGEWWRAMTLVPGASSFDEAGSPRRAREAGAVLGQFHLLLSDLDPGRLKETLPGFHVIPRYLEAYDRTLGLEEGRRRLAGSAEARRLAGMVAERRDDAGALESARARGELSPRVIHGDPKLNNIMLDDRTGLGVGMVDLDTVGPGLLQHDFGDALRSVCNPAGEEAEDPEAARFDLDLCEAFLRGYMPRARELLTAADQGRLFDAVRLVAFELGLRFLQDHLAGDIYFKTRRPGHNLRRAGVQLHLCLDIEAKEAAVRRLLERP